MTEKELRKYLRKASYNIKDLSILRDLTRKLKHDLDVSHLEIRRFRKAIKTGENITTKIPIMNLVLDV